MYITWKVFLDKIEEVYDTYVDHEEEFFNCPECGEPIYEEDFPRKGTYCPCCEFKLF